MAAGPGMKFSSAITTKTQRTQRRIEPCSFFPALCLLCVFVVHSSKKNRRSRRTVGWLVSGSAGNRRFGSVILDEISEITIFAFTDRPVEADGMPADLEDASGLFDADPGRFGRLLDGRLAAHFLEQLLGNVAKLAHGLNHVH